VGPARLFYLVGASGVGKDSLIRYARDALGRGHAVVFAHRYITRAPEPKGENHVELSTPEFTLRKRRGLFAMAWQSHGFHYAIGVEIDGWLAKGLTVVVNGSRSYLPAARKRYPGMTIVWISAKPQVLAARLARRGRESGTQISERLERNDRLGVKPPRGALQINNEGTIEAAGSELVKLLRARRSG
jgi:ribose 1,5-bisphosphokinase